MIRQLRLTALLLCGVLPSGAFAAEVIPPAPEQYFNDYAGLVPSDTAAALNHRLEIFERETSCQIIVAIYPHMLSASSIEDYTVRVAQSWHAGQKAKSNGAVLFIFKDDHTLCIQTGYGLEGALPDAICKHIINDEIMPHFRQGDYSGGIEAGVNALLAAAHGEYRGTGRTVAEQQGGGAGLLVPVMFFLVLLLISFGRARSGTVYHGRGRRSLWLNSGPWLGGGGFGGGGGGFSGGGGSFGGGGASGRW